MTTQPTAPISTFRTVADAANTVVAQARTVAMLTDAMLSRPARQPAHRNFADIRLAAGWVFAAEQLAEPVVEWPDLAVQLVVAAKDRGDRLTLHARFQLFDVIDGGWTRIIASEDFHEILGAIAKVRNDIATGERAAQQAAE